MNYINATFIEYYRAKLHTVESQRGSDFAEGVLETAAEQCLAGRLNLLVARVYVVEFHRYRESLGLPADPLSEIASKSYAAEFSEATVLDWFTTYPRLKSMLDQVVENSVRHIGEIAERFASDRSLLVSEGLLGDRSTPSSIRQMAADSHNQGRTVAVIGFDSGDKLIYKPRSLGAECMIRRLLRVLGDAQGRDLEHCAPRSVDRISYGWQEFISTDNAKTNEDVSNYYEELGAVTALMGVIGASDLHHENVLADQDHPVLLDLETALSAMISFNSDTIPWALIGRVKLSAANTMLLPQRMPSGPYSILMGGIGIPYEQISERTDYVQVDVDTDAVDIARKNFPHRQTDNVLRRSDGTTTDVLDYQDEFFRGYRNTYRAIELHSDVLWEVLSAESFPIRQILRSTAVYAKLLDALTHPDNLKDDEAAQRVYAVLSPPMGNYPWTAFSRRFLAAEEKAALEQGDIPLFTVDSADVRVRSGRRTGHVLWNLSPLDRAKVGLRSMSVRGLAQEENLIHEGMAELRVERIERNLPMPKNPPRPFANAWKDGSLDAETAIAEFRALAVEVDGAQGREVGWLGTSVGRQRMTYEPGISVAFHDAGGVAALFARSADQDPGDRNKTTFSADVDRGIASIERQQRESLQANPLSAISGPISLEYLFGHGAARIEAIEMYVDDMLSTGTSEQLNNADALLGLPGAGLILSGLPDTDKMLMARVRAATALSGGRKGEWDLAHGDVGLDWSQFRMAKALDDYSGAALIAERIREKIVRAPDDLPIGWCSGAGGLIMVAGDLARAGTPIPDLRRLINLACALEGSHVEIDLSVCHGAAGVVQSLVWLADCLEETWPLDDAENYWNAAMAKAASDGYYIGAQENYSALGYFLGWSGVLDTMTLLKGALEGRREWVPLSLTDTTRATANRL
ncbi:type 2 lanthipeptide synthetase LanM [Cryobacterium sp. Sr3]|uniref:type 2 lanthipeptide synthetase LanM n=1 Tax=Cryobacterium sp. Sr3 TaxID=1259194 RepID=UPI001069E213|nr:type 2 lanthipeptide synthetase LanM [Cryobacterium sp. Sr3]TFB53418.1 type 2 lantipeptide synthetase LanM [Cryobacterium sp. Sr3]